MFFLGFEERLEANLRLVSGEGAESNLAKGQDPPSRDDGGGAPTGGGAIRLPAPSN